MSSNKDLNNIEQDYVEYDENIISDFDSVERANEIVEYYKNIPFEEDAETTDLELTEKCTLLDKIKRCLNIKHDLIDINSADDEAVYESSYGTSTKQKSMLRYILVVFVCVSIIGFSFFTAIKMPKQSSVLNAKIEQLKNNDEYISLKKDYDDNKAEIDELRKSVSEKEEFLKQISDYENTKASLRESLELKKSELNELNTQITSKQAEIDSIKSTIDQNSSSIITLSPGRYKVGENIAAGVYSVTGAGKLAVSTKDNNNKVNQILGSSAIEITLDDGDNIKLETTAKFTSIN